MFTNHAPVPRAQYCGGLLARCTYKTGLPIFQIKQDYIILNINKNMSTFNMNHYIMIFLFKIGFFHFICQINILLEIDIQISVLCLTIKIFISLLMYMLAGH